MADDRVVTSLRLPADELATWKVEAAAANLSLVDLIRQRMAAGATAEAAPEGMTAVRQLAQTGRVRAASDSADPTYKPKPGSIASALSGLPVYKG